MRKLQCASAEPRPAAGGLAAGRYRPPRPSTARRGLRLSRGGHHLRRRARRAGHHRQTRHAAADHLARRRRARGPKLARHELQKVPGRQLPDLLYGDQPRLDPLRARRRRVARHAQLRRDVLLGRRRRVLDGARRDPVRRARVQEPAPAAVVARRRALRPLRPRPRPDAAGQAVPRRRPRAQLLRPDAAADADEHQPVVRRRLGRRQPRVPGGGADARRLGPQPRPRRARPAARELPVGRAALPGDGATRRAARRRPRLAPHRSPRPPAHSLVTPEGAHDCRLPRRRPPTRRSRKRSHTSAARRTAASSASTRSSHSPRKASP